MIPRTAFAALTALMLSAWAFGIACDRLFTAWMQGRTDGSEDSTDDGTEADHDRWEDDPEPTNRCDTCRWEKVPQWDEEAHCSACDGYDGWEGR